MVHVERMMLHVLWVSAVWAVGARGFLFRRTDCQVSAWSPWSEPFGFGQVSRERAILRYPDNGGTICPPELEQIKITGKRASIQSTAKSIATNFMVQNSLTNSLSEGRLRDLLVIVDGSGSIGPTNFNDTKYQLARLLGMLCPTPDPFKVYQRAALIEFSSNVREIFDFNDKANTLAVQQGVKGMPYFGGSTCTATAFNFARNTMFTAVKGMRNSDAKQEVLILTDGESNCGGDAVQAAKLLDKTAKVYGLMIGNHSTAGMQKLTNYVSSPKKEHLFALENARELSQLVDLVEQQLKSIRCAPFDI
ncbi:COCA1-like protein [Mya arenaria]|uniref:COCA1-like protein n=1 Tax=Mya arenaria TaxID=6604 RepID=A0ABY7E480_MYAAR|nr:collagen alpha-1(XII) chain-like [Mya arenaria]WAR04019.1 COCA1-like protein [Mya arenaria]